MGEPFDPPDYDEDGLGEQTSGTNQLEIMIKCAVAGLVGVFCVVGNLLVLRTLIFFKHPKIPIYIIIGGLALADFFTAVVEIPNFVMKWTSEEYITKEWCSAINYLTTTCKYIAACHIGCLSIIRCIMLNDRHRSKSYVRHALGTSILIWICVIFANLHSVFYSSVQKNDVIDDDTFPKGCIQNEGMDEVAERNKWLRISFSFFFPMFVTLVVYIVTWFFTQRYFEDSYSHGERRLARLVTIIVVTFAVCKLPLQIVDLMIFYAGKSLTNKLMTNQMLDDETIELYNSTRTLIKVLYICECIALLDMAIRPFIYAKLTYYFRKGFDEILNCTTCRENRPPPRQKIKRRRNGPSQTPLTEENELEESPDVDPAQSVNRNENDHSVQTTTIVEISNVEK